MKGVNLFPEIKGSRVRSWQFPHYKSISYMVKPWWRTTFAI